LGALDEPFISKVKILERPSMVGFCAYGSDTKRDPRTEKMKDRFVILERTIKQMTGAMCQHGEKVGQMEVEMDRMKHGFNEVVREC
jgi:hypothetical protein